MNLRNTRRHWQALGKQNPLYAILTLKEVKDGKWDEAEFFKTGQDEIKKTFEYLSSLNLKPEPGRAVDFGCGAGRLTQALAPHFEETHGVDIAHSMIELANKYNKFGEKCKYHVNEENNLKLFPDNHFDFVFTKITLQHMEPAYMKNYLKEFLRILKTGGVMFFQLPESPTARLDEYKSPARSFIKKIIPKLALDIYYNLKHFYHPIIEMYGTPREEIINLIEQGGAKVVAVKENQDAGDKWISLDYSVTK